MGGRTSGSGDRHQGLDTRDREVMGGRQQGSRHRMEGQVVQRRDKGLGDSWGGKGGGDQILSLCSCLPFCSLRRPSNH